MNEFNFDLQRFATPSPENLMLGAGQIFFDRLDANGNRTGLRHLGNVPKFNIKTEVDKIQKKSCMTAARATYAEAVKEIKLTSDITLEEFDLANLSIGLFGQEGVIAQTAGTVSDELHKAYKSCLLKTDAYKISEVSIKPLQPTASSIGSATAVGTITSDGTVTSSGTYTGTTAEDYYVVITAAPTTPGAIAGCKFKWKKGLAGTLSADVIASGNAQNLEVGIQVTLAVSGTQTFVVGDTWKISVVPSLTEYVAGIDYKVDTILLRGGAVMITETSRIANGDDVKVSYTKAAAVIPKISGGTAGKIEGYLMFLGDPTKGPAYNAECWRVSVTPNGDIGMISDDWASFDINITIQDDSANHPDDPYYRYVKLT